VGQCRPAGDPEGGDPSRAEVRVFLSEMSAATPSWRRSGDRLPVRAGVDAAALVVPPPGPVVEALDLLAAEPDPWRWCVLGGLVEQILPRLLTPTTPPGPRVAGQRGSGAGRPGLGRLYLGQEIREEGFWCSAGAGRPGARSGSDRWPASNGCWGAAGISQVHGHLDTPTTMFLQPLRAESDASCTVRVSARQDLCRGPRRGKVRHILAKERIERDDEDLVRLYLTDIGQYPLLTKDDEVRLAQAIEAGRESEAAVAKAPKGLTTAKKREMRRAVMEGEQAQQTFVQSNLRLVVSIAKKYQASGLPLLDLIQEGNLGLMHAVEKFDWRKGFKFSTYATWWIRQAITRGIANTGRTIRLPVHAGDTLARVQKAQARLELKLGRPATLAELGIEVEMPEDKLVEALRFRAEPLSLSEPLREDGDAELGDVVEDRSAESPFEVAAVSLLPDEIGRLLSPLDEREREILRLRFGLDRGEPRTLEEVGEHFNLTRERIRQIEARAMSKLRHPSSDTGARDLLTV
jgi:RNA polymerase sigma factor (sigma-70 family)